MSTYTLTVITDFSASHIIPGHPGKCARLHGHNWKVELSVQSQVLDELGMAVDFAEVKAKAKTVIDTVDHQHLNDIPPFDKLSPTAENISAWLYQRLATVINNKNVTVSAVTLWETDRSRVQYSEG
jgi:6-pyruvoyltetrahydropterin/6-carboxytetrahydropterin synthase